MANGIFERHRSLLLLVGSLLAGSALLGLAVFHPKMKTMERLRAEVNAKTEQLAEQFRLWEEISHRRDETTRVWDELLDRFDERVPAQPDLERFMAELTSLMVRRRLQEIHLSIDDEKRAAAGAVAEGPNLSTASGASPGEVEPAARTRAVAEIRYRLLFAATYQDLAELLDDLPRMHRLVALRALSVYEKEGKMETALAFSIFYRVEP